VGFDRSDTANRGHGLRNITARAKDIGARTEIISASGQGTRVLVEIPSNPL